MSIRWYNPLTWFNKINPTDYKVEPSSIKDYTFDQIDIDEEAPVLSTMDNKEDKSSEEFKTKLFREKFNKKQGK